MKCAYYALKSHGITNNMNIPRQLQAEIKNGNVLHDTIKKALDTMINGYEKDVDVIHVENERAYIRETEQAKEVNELVLIDNHIFHLLKSNGIYQHNNKFLENYLYDDEKKEFLENYYLVMTKETLEEFIKGNTYIIRIKIF